MKRLVSGIQPSGILHVGNYLGAIKQWVELQSDYDCFFFIADYHALTTRPKPESLQAQTLSTLAMLIALGLDPKNAVLFLQSQIPEHAELAWLLLPFATIGQLNRMTQYKEKADQHSQNVGLLTYPVLMAADILLYEAEVVPVGDDQVQHLELAREIARAFNARLGQTFVEPKPLINKAARIMALNNPTKKMSKSVVGSAVGLLDSPEEIETAIKRAVTDSDPNSSKKSPGLENLFTLLEGFGDEDTFRRFENLYQNGQLQYAELKAQVTEDVVSFLKPVQKTFKSLVSSPDQLSRILEEGRKKAQPIAQERLIEAKKKLGLVGS